MAVRPQRLRMGRFVDGDGIDPREPLEHGYEAGYDVQLDFGLQAVRDEYQRHLELYRPRTCRNQFCSCRGYTPLGAA